MHDLDTNGLVKGNVIFHIDKKWYLKNLEE